MPRHRSIPRPLTWPRNRRQWARWYPMATLLAGAVLITMSSQVKLPGLLALGFVAMALACRWGGTVKAFFIAGGSLSAVSLAVMAVIGWASGLGFGWLFTLGTANVVRSWMSPPTLLALGTGQVGILLGLGDHTTAVLALTRAIGVSLIAVIVTWLLFAVLRGRLHPVGGLGVALGATVLLFPVVQPWYLLWAIIPLAAWATRAGFPRDGDRRHPGRRDLRADRERRPVRAVPDRDGDARELADRAGADRADLSTAAVAPDSRPAPRTVCRATGRHLLPSPTPTLSPRDLPAGSSRAAARGQQAVRIDDRGVRARLRRPARRGAGAPRTQRGR